MFLVSCKCHRVRLMGLSTPNLLSKIQFQTFSSSGLLRYLTLRSVLWLVFFQRSIPLKPCQPKCTIPQGLIPGRGTSYAATGAHGTYSESKLGIHRPERKEKFDIFNSVTQRCWKCRQIMRCRQYVIHEIMVLFMDVFNACLFNVQSNTCWRLGMFGVCMVWEANLSVVHATAKPLRCILSYTCHALFPRQLIIIQFSIDPKLYLFIYPLPPSISAKQYWTP